MTMESTDEVGGAPRAMAAEHAVPEQALPEQVLPEQAVPEQPLVEQGTTLDHGVPEQGVPEQALPAPRPAAARPARPPLRCARTAVLVAADGLTAAVALAVVHGPAHALWTLGPVLAALLVLHARGGLYRPGLPASALDELPRLLARGVLAWSVATALVATAGVVPPPDWSGLLTLVGVQVALACAVRGAVYAGLRHRGRRRPRSALVVGTGPAGHRVAAALHLHREYGMRPVGMVDTGSAAVPEPFPVPVLSAQEDIVRAVIQNSVRDAVFLRSGCVPDPRAAALVPLFAELGCAVWLVNTGQPPTGCAAGAVPGGRSGHLWGYSCHRIDTAPRQRVGRAAKRALDVTAAALALLAAAPLLLACALAVRLVDGPGVIFRQVRVGTGSRPFVILKFRTLRPADAHESATLWNVAHDRRMSGVGRLLRRTSLDELPQLWNVLRGDMSLVGPRPERPYFVRKFSQSLPGYAARHRMPAGITGLAQVHGLRGDTSIEDRARFDNHYIETWSLWQDVRILLRTAGLLFRSQGS